MVERDGFAFLVDIEYEKTAYVLFLMFCYRTHCLSLQKLNVDLDKPNLGSKKVVAHYVKKTNKQEVIQEPIDLDPMVHLKSSLDKGKAILVEDD